MIFGTPIKSKNKVLAALIAFNFSKEEYEKIWRLVLATFSYLDPCKENWSIADSIDTAYSLSMLAIVSPNELTFDELTYRLDKTISIINASEETIKDNLLYKIFFISHFIRRSNLNIHDIKTPLFERSEKHIASLNSTPTISPLQEQFEKFLKEAGIGYEVESVVNGLSIDFKLDTGVFVQIDGRRHLKFGIQEKKSIFRWIFGEIFKSVPYLWSQLAKQKKASLSSSYPDLSGM